MHYSWGQAAAKKQCGHFGQCTSRKTEQCNLTLVDLNDNRVVYIASSKFCEPKRFVPRLKKVEGKHNIQINSTNTTRTGLFLKGWARAFPSTRLVPESKNGGDPRLLKCYMF